ncbi:hypothetical protein BaRGS_00022269 [Batillaria attramentaria]|uniref:Uncharacterized protein n=1 Tax=Batillaria attramentaria TaxID=370345 RepID=A0ABD0KHD7_9CAEN
MANILCFGAVVAIFYWLSVFATMFPHIHSEPDAQPTDQFKPCGDVGGMCRCHGTIADCSENYDGELTFIPYFSRPITKLIFSSNALRSIDSDQFFWNVTELTDLDISRNSLSYVSQGAFSVFKRLKTLDVQVHELNYSQLEQIFAIRTLEKLDLSNGDLGPLPDDLFYRYPLPKLEVLSLNENVLEFVNMTALKPLPSLKSFSVRAAWIREVYSDHLPFLELLDIGENTKGLVNFPKTCDGSGESFFPSLVYLDLGLSLFLPWSSESYLCLPRLTELYLDYNHIEEVNMTVFKYLGNLTQLYLVSSQIHHINPAYLPSLERLEVGDNSFSDFPATCSDHGQSFYPALSYLDLRSNRKRLVVSELDLCLPQLKRLVLEDTELGELNMTKFKSLTNLRGLYAGIAKITKLVFDFREAEHLEQQNKRYSRNMFRGRPASPSTFVFFGSFF